MPRATEKSCTDENKRRNVIGIGSVVASPRYCVSNNISMYYDAILSAHRTVVKWSDPIMSLFSLSDIRTEENLEKISARIRSPVVHNCGSHTGCRVEFQVEFWVTRISTGRNFLWQNLPADLQYPVLY